MVLISSMMALLILTQYAVRPAIDRKEDAVQLPLIRKDDLRAVGFAVALVGLALELAVQAGALVGSLVEVGAARRGCRCCRWQG